MSQYPVTLGGSAMPRTAPTRSNRAFSLFEVIIGMLVAAVLMIGMATMFQVSIYQGKVSRGAGECQRHFENGRHLLLHGSARMPGLLQADMADWPGVVGPPRLEYHVGSPWNASYVVCLASSLAPLPPDQNTFTGQLIRFQSAPVVGTEVEVLMGDSPPPDRLRAVRDGIVVATFVAEIITPGPASATLASMAFRLFHNLSADYQYDIFTGRLSTNAVEDGNEVGFGYRTSCLLRNCAP